MQGRHQQRPYGPHVQTNPGPQRGAKPRHATRFTVGVAVWRCAWPDPSCWAYADRPIEPSASAAAAKVKVSVFINPPPDCRMPMRADDDDAATTRPNTCRPGV